MALLGIPEYLAVFSDCAKVMPPSALMALRPSLPSEAVPHRITPLGMLPCVGSRCCTRTKAIPVFSGRCESTLVNASRPPAEAPKPTIGKMCFLEGGFDGAVFFFIRLATNEHECARTRTVSHLCAFGA